MANQDHIQVLFVEKGIPSLPLMSPLSSSHPVPPADQGEARGGGRGGGEEEQGGQGQAGPHEGDGGRSDKGQYSVANPSKIIFSMLPI